MEKPVGWEELHRGSHSHSSQLIQLAGLEEELRSSPRPQLTHPDYSLPFLVGTEVMGQNLGVFMLTDSALTLLGISL